MFMERTSCYSKKETLKNKIEKDMVCVRQLDKKSQRLLLVSKRKGTCGMARTAF
jgi:hypothetical protein